MKYFALFILSLIPAEMIAQHRDTASEINLPVTYVSHHNVSIHLGYIPSRNYATGLSYEYVFNPHSQGRWRYSAEASFNYISLSSSGILLDDQIVGGTLRAGVAWRIIRGRYDFLEAQVIGFGGVSGGEGFIIPSYAIGYRWQSDNSPFVTRIGIGVPDFIYFKVGVVLF